MKFKIETTNETLVCSELNLNQYKEILKNSFGDSPDFEVFCQSAIEILEKLTNKQREFFESLSLVDFLIILFDLSIFSQGDEKQLLVTVEEKQATLSFNLEKARNQIKEFYKKVFEEVLKINDFEIKLNCPSLKRLKEPLKEEELYISFIEKITHKGLSFKIETNQQAIQIFELLPPKVALQVIDHFEKSLKQFVNFNLLEIYNLKEQKITFVPTIQSFMWFVKLLFNEPLNVFYDNLFYLAHLGHMNLEYIDKCSPGEYIYFTKKLEGVLAQRSKQNSPSDDSQRDISSINDDGLFGDVS